MSIIEPKIRLLCVDDSAQLTSAWARLIANQPDMEMAGILHSADRLIETVRNSRPHVVLIDLAMAGKDPLDALTEMRAAFPEVQALVYSGRNDFDLPERAKRAGAVAFLDKVTLPSKILETIRRVARSENG